MPLDATSGGEEVQTETDDKVGVSVAHQALEGSLYSVGASVVTLVLGFARSVLLARLLLPEHFGVVALALFYIGLVARLRGLDLDAALIHRQDVDEIFLRTHFTARVGLDALSAGLLFAVTPLLKWAYPEMVDLTAVLRVLIVAYSLSNLSQVQETLLRKNLAFSKLAVIDVVASIVMTVVALYLAWHNWGVWALVGEQLSGLSTRFMMSWGFFRLWWPRLGWDWSKIHWLWQYSRPTWVVTNLGYLLSQFDDFWVGTALGKTPLGYYAKSYEYAHYPRRVFANPLVSVLGPVFARFQDDRQRLSQAFYRSAHFILRTSVFIAGAFALVLPEFMHFVIGDKWLPMLWTFRLMLIYTALDSLLMLVGTLMLAVGHPQELRNVALIQTVFFIPAVILGAYLWGINGVALAADGMLLLGAWLYYRSLGRIVDFSVMRLVTWPGVALATALGVGFFMETFVTRVQWQVFLMKLGSFSLLFGSVLVCAERGDYLQGFRWLLKIVRERWLM